MPEFPDDDILAGIGRVIPLVSIDISKLQGEFKTFIEGEVEGL